jgi:cell wall-associated NlpC family hydrolase
MPPRFRSRMLALALAVFLFGCTIEDAAARPDPERARPSPRLTFGQRVARIAVKAVGVPYRWGGSSPSTGFDCSGLVSWAYGRLGIALPHSSYALYDKGRPVPVTRLKAGDMLFFSGLGHVGLYLSRGRMIHAPHSGALVEVVRLGRSGYGSRLVGARRIVRR